MTITKLSYTTSKAEEIVEAVRGVSEEFNRISCNGLKEPNYAYMVGYMKGIIRELLETATPTQIDEIIRNIK